MTHLKMRTYKAEDFLTMQLLETEKKSREGEDVEFWARAHEVAGPAVTFTDAQGEIVFCCGVTDFWRGVGEVWSVFSPLAARYPHTLQAMKWAIRYLFEKRGYLRIQATVDVDNEAAIRFDEHVGFKREAIMRHYGPHGEDRILYAMLKEDLNG